MDQGLKTQVTVKEFSQSFVWKSKVNANLHLKEELMNCWSVLKTNSRFNKLDPLSFAFLPLK